VKELINSPPNRHKEKALQGRSFFAERRSTLTKPKKQQSTLAFQGTL